MTKLVKDLDKEVVQTFVLGPNNHTVTIGVSSAASSAFNANTRVVRLYADTDTWIKIGPSPTATASDVFLPQGVVVYHGCNGGDAVAGLQVSAGGTLYVSEMV